MLQDLEQQEQAAAAAATAACRRMSGMRLSARTARVASLSLLLGSRCWPRPMSACATSTIARSIRSRRPRARRRWRSSSSASTARSRTATHPRCGGSTTSSRRRASPFSLVYPNPVEPVAAIRRHLKDYSYPMRALRDPRHELVKTAGATITPEAAVFDPHGRLLYRGRIDDRYVSLGLERPVATRHDLDEALTDIVAGKAPAPGRRRRPSAVSSRTSSRRRRETFRVRELQAACRYTSGFQSPRCVRPTSPEMSHAAAAAIVRTISHRTTIRKNDASKAGTWN